MNSRIYRMISAMGLSAAILTGCATTAVEPETTRDKYSLDGARSTQLSAVEQALWSEYLVGLQAFRSQDYSHALQMWTSLADRGFAKAQGSLGYMHLQGLGTVADASVALTWLNRAAENNDPDAQNNLGYMYAKGVGVEVDETKAIHYYLMAAKQDHRPAQYNLEAMYKEHIMDPRNLEKKGKFSDSVKAKAEKGELLYQYLLGLRYLKGQDVQEDHEAALKWLTKAAEKGFAAAQFTLGSLYSKGEKFPRDEDRGMYWIQRAAEQKYDSAIKWLKKHRSSGNNVAQVYSKLQQQEVIN